MDTGALIGVAVGLVIGALLQAVTGWLQDKRTTRYAHQRWLTETRYAAYTRLMDTLYKLTAAEPLGEAERSRAEINLSEAMTQAIMISDPLIQDQILQIMLGAHEALELPSADVANTILIQRERLRALFTPLIV